jgi:hypothetical protein
MRRFEVAEVVEVAGQDRGGVLIACDEVLRKGAGILSVWT